jgi:hypothetical protein
MGVPRFLRVESATTYQIFSVLVRNLLSTARTARAAKKAALKTSDSHESLWVLLWRTPAKSAGVEQIPGVEQIC